MRMTVTLLILTLLAAGCVDMAGSFSPKDDPDNPYSVIISPISYGKVIPNRVNAALDANINLTIVPNAGYEYVGGTLKVTSLYDGAEIEVSGGGNSRNFNMPASHVIVSAEFEPVTYSITIEQTVNGVVESSHETAVLGDIITLTVTPDSGFILLENTLVILREDNISVNRAGYSFTMPASNVKINAQFSWLYKIEVNASGHGDVFVSHESSITSTPITVTFTPETGYRVKDGSFSIANTANVTVSAKLSVTEYYIQTYDFIMPACDIVIIVEFEVIPPGVISVYFEGFYDEDMNLNQAGYIIRSGSNDVITITVASDFESYYWYLNDMKRQETSNSLTVDSYRLGLGLHTIAVVVVKDNVPYSKIVTFTVVN